MPYRPLIEAVDRLPRHAIAASVLRHISPGYLPLSAEGARIHGGRWNPPASFSVLYTAFDRATVMAELERAARRQGLTIDDLLPRDEVAYAVSLQRVLDLHAPANLEAVGLSENALSAPDWGPCQAVGDAAHYVGFEGIHAPSATGTGSTLAILLDRLTLGSTIEVVSIPPLVAHVDNSASS
jgi:RES domain-containing protein